MKEVLSSRERLMIAVAGGKPDRVPVIPDFSNMIPAKMTGKPFWEIYMNNNPSLYRAYCKAAEYYGIDGWYQAHDAVTFRRKNEPVVTRTITGSGGGRMVERFTFTTPAGDLWEEHTYLEADPPTKTVKMVKNLPDDFPRIRYFFGEIESYDASLVQEYRSLCRMAREAGVLTMLHSCGKSMALVEMLANETDLDCINPLEEPPMGDVDLAEVKKLYGKKLSLMGNLPTTTVMLKGTPADVERAAKKAIDDAGKDGGFLLSTGDQCGRDTPEANLFKLVETAKTYGKY